MPALVSIDHDVSREDPFALGIQNALASGVTHNDVSGLRFG